MIILDLIVAVGAGIVSLALLPMLLDNRTKIPLKTSIPKVIGYILVVVGLALNGLLIASGVEATLLLCWVLILLLRRL